MPMCESVGYEHMSAGMEVRGEAQVPGILSHLTCMPVPQKISLDFLNHLKIIKLKNKKLIHQLKQCGLHFRAI